MDKKIISDAVCGIDEKYLSAYDNSVNKVKVKKIMNKKLIAAAACVAVVAASGIGLYAGGVFDRQPSVLPETSATQTSVTPETADAQSEEPVTVHDLLPPGESSAQESLPAENSQTDVPETAPVIEAQPSPAETTTGIEAHPPALIDAPVTAAEQTETTEQNKGGDTSEFLQRHAVGPDGCYYEIFRPGTDVFDPVDEMSLENRFCSVTYNGYWYYPASGDMLTSDEYEAEVLYRTKCSNLEIRSSNSDDEVAGIEYVAAVEIHRLPGVDTTEAVACVISFNGETQAYRFLGTPQIKPSYP